MSLSPARQTDSLLTPLGPFILCLFLTLLTILPYQTNNIHMFMPLFALTGVFFWTVGKPEHMPMLAVFLLGLVTDLWSGGPPGVQVLLMIIARLFLLGQRRFIIGKSVVVSWLAFAIVCLAWGILYWGLNSMYFGLLLNPLGVIIQVTITIIFYPLIGGFYGWIQTRVLNNRRPLPRP